jgi:putative (di)nucleoside polyphosphate hydrolase
MIDSEGYRHNVGIVLCNDYGRLFWARRAGMNSWQFPQGGIKSHEDPECAMFRELYEETGLSTDDVQVLGRTKDWLRYDLPKRFIRRRSLPLCIGQKQIWFILRMLSSGDQVRFDCSDKPEFDMWRWVDFWYPLGEVVFFKKMVYRQALTELGAYLVSDTVPINAEGFLSRRNDVMYDRRQPR